MKQYTKKIITLVMATALLLGSIMVDYRQPVSSRAEEATVTQANTDGTSASSSTETGEQTGPQAEGTEGQTSPAATTQGAEAQMGEQGPEVANSPANQTVQEPQDITDFVDVKLEALDIIDHTEKTEYNYTMVDGKIVALKVTNKKEKPPVVTEYTMSADGKLLDADKNEFPGLLLNQWSRVNMKWGWGVTGDNMSHVKKGNYFKIPLPAHITNTGKHFDFRTPNGQKMGTFIVKNGFLTATFTEENDTYNMDELKNGFFKVSEEIYPVEEETEVPIEHQEEVILKLKIKKKPDSNGGNPGTPGPKPDYKPSGTPLIFKKEGGQSNWHIRNGCVFFKFSVNHDKLIKMFETPDNVPVIKDVFLDDYKFPDGLAIDANSFEIKMPLHAAADIDVDKASNYILHNYWVYYQKAKDDKIKNSFIVIDKAQDLNDTNLQSPDSFRDYIKSEFKNHGGKPVIGVWDKRYLVIAFGDLPQSTIKYGDLRTNTDPNGPGETIAQTITRLEGAGKLTADQATKLRKVYAPDKAVAMFNIAFVADITDSDETEFENEAKLHWATDEQIGSIKLENIQHQEGGVEGGLEYIDIKVVKQWAGGKKPAANFKLVGEVDGKPYSEEAFTLNDDNNWTKLFENKRTRDGATHKPIKYSVEEEQIPGYEKDIKKVTEGKLHTYTVSNIREMVNVPVSKAWQELDGSEFTPAEGKKIKVYLKRNGEVKKNIDLPQNGAWSYTFTNLEKYDDNGKLYKYTVDEDIVEGFEKSISGAADTGFIITNKKTEIPKIDIKVTKEWVNNKGNKLPNGHDKIPAEIEVGLYINGETTPIQKAKIKKSDSWTYIFKDVDEKRLNGSKIDYLVQEINVPEGFTSEAVRVDSSNKAVLRNKLTDDTVKVIIKKEWKDENGKVLTTGMPNEVTVNILKQLDDNSYDPAKVEVKLNAGNGWKAEATLDKFDENGKKIVYDVQEVDIPQGYSAVKEKNGEYTFTFTNQIIPKTSMNIIKKWLDEDGVTELSKEYQKIPDEITVQLYVNGTADKTIKVSKTAGWKASFTDLPIKDPYNNAIVYDVKEIHTPDGFTSSKSVDGNIVTITNRKTTEVVKIRIEKKWLDLSNNTITDINRLPSNVAFRLFADGVSKGKIYVQKTDNWQYLSEPLPKLDKNGKEISYTIEEVDLYGYKSSIVKGADGYSFTVTNKEVPTPPNPYIPPYTPDQPIITPPDIPTPPAPRVPIDEIVIEDDEVVLANNDESIEDPEEEEITDDIPRVNKDVPKTHDFLMSGAANPLAVSTLLMMGYGVKKLLTKKKEKKD